MYIQIDPTEHATILAALRYYQDGGQGEPANRSDDIHELATAGDDVVSLDASAIDELCERINCERIDDLDVDVPFAAPPFIHTLVIDTDNGTSTHLFANFRKALDFLALDCKAVDDSFTIDGMDDQQALDALSKHFENSSSWYVLNENAIEDHPEARTAAPLEPRSDQPTVVIQVEGGLVQSIVRSQPELQVYILDRDNDDGNETHRAMPLMNGDKLDYDAIDVGFWDGATVAPAYCNMVRDAYAAADGETGGRYTVEFLFNGGGTVGKWAKVVKGLCPEHAAAVAKLAFERDGHSQFNITAATIDLT